MNSPRCAADDCKQPFEPIQEGQKYCSVQCRSRAGVHRYRARKRFGDDGGGGPGGKRQARLFSRSELHRTKPKPVKSAVKPKSGDLFPEDGVSLYATFGGAVDCAQEGAVSDNGERYAKYSVKSGKRPSHSVPVIPEAPLAA